MAAPDKDSVQSLDYYQNGQPFANVLAPNGTTGNLDYYQNAQPFMAYASTTSTVNSGFFFMFM